MEQQNTFGLRAVFFALVGALFGALCAADSNVTMTLIADSYANDQMYRVVDEFTRNGGAVRGTVGAIVGLLAGLGLFVLMRGSSKAGPDDRNEAFI